MLTINSIAVALWFGICMITSVIFCPDVVYHGPTLLEIKEDWEDLEISELLVCIATCPDHLTTSHIGYGKTRLRVTPIETRLWHLSLSTYAWPKSWKRANTSLLSRVDISISSMDYQGINVKPCRKKIPICFF